MSTPAVRIVEVGPRDGLQNEKQIVPVADKRRLIEGLAQCGLQTVEATSFVSPKWIPQLADAEELLGQLQRQPGVSYPVLVPNLKGYERAAACQVDEIAVFIAASDAFNQRNINATTAEAFERIEPVLARALADGVRVRSYVSTALGCPYQGEVPLADVVAAARKLHEMGCYEISLGDTIGVGTPGQARQMLQAVAAEVPMSALAVHFHDTRGQALANILACVEAGARIVDASVAGLGGCPYARGASGNVATEDVVYMLDGLGLSTGVDLQALAAMGRWICDLLNRPNGSKVGVALEAAQS